MAIIPSQHLYSLQVNCNFYKHYVRVLTGVTNYNIYWVFILLLVGNFHFCLSIIMLISKILWLFPEYDTYMSLLCQVTPADQRKNKLVSMELKAGQSILSNKVKIRLRKPGVPGWLSR